MSRERWVLNWTNLPGILESLVSVSSFPALRYQLRYVKRTYKVKVFI